jgi:hypothetical protein
MFATYFSNKNYTAIYLHVFGDKIGNRLLELFTGVLFYHLGMPLPFILLFFGLEFGLRGLIAPFSSILVSKMGIRKAITLSYVFLLIFFVFIGFAHISLVIGFCSFIFQSLSRGIYYPCIDTLHSVFIKDGSRGRQYTLELVFTAIAGLLAVGVGSSVLAGKFVLAVVALAVILAIAIIPLFFIDKVETVFTNRVSDSYKFLSSKEFRENILPFSGQSIAIIANQIIVPVFLFVLVAESTSSFTFILLLSIIIEMIITLLYGVWIDKKGHKKTLEGASFFQSIGNIGYIMAMRASSLLVFLTGFNNTAWDMYTSNYNSRIQQKANKSSNPFLFNTATQMTLCFVEVIVLSLFALIAWQWGNVVFLTIFLCSIASLFISTKYFVD